VHDRPRRQGDGRESPPQHPPAGRSGARRGPAVGVRADSPQRRPRARDHDRDRQLQLGRSPATWVGRATRRWRPRAGS
jgi:hypothetical protein